MAHELDSTGGVTFFADSQTDAQGRVDAWHKLGQAVGHCMTAEQVMEESKLGNWNVRKHGIWTKGDDGFPVQIEDRMATVRTNPITGNTDYLGVVGKGYQPIQNEESADFLNALVDESGAHFETAGALREGRSTFVTMKLPEYMTFHGTNGVIDHTDLYLTALNGHDGLSAFRVIISPVRVVCANTETAAIASAKSSWSVRHTAHALKAIEEARQATKIAFRYADAFADEMNKLIEAEIDRDQAKVLLDTVFQVDTAETERQKNSRAEHAAAALGGLELKTVVGFEKTRFGLYNAVTEYVDHRMEVRKGVYGAPAFTAIEGSYADLKNRAFAVLSA